MAGKSMEIKVDVKRVFGISTPWFIAIYSRVVLNGKPRNLFRCERQSRGKWGLGVA